MAGLFAGAFVLGLVGTVTASVRLSRTKPVEPPAWQVSAPPSRTHTKGPIGLRSDQGVKIEQFRTLAALRDSGTLTDKEFQAEKRKVLDDS